MTIFRMVTAGLMGGSFGWVIAQGFFKGEPLIAVLALGMLCLWANVRAGQLD